MDLLFQMTSNLQEWYPLGMARFFLVCCLFLAPSCASLSQDEGSVITRPFSSVDASQEIVLAPNHTFEIVLPSNPTTGYDWSLHINHPEVVKNLSHTYVADSSGRIGVGGNTTWSLRTGAIGSTTLKFSYNRSWEEDTPPTRVVTFTMHVR